MNINSAGGKWLAVIVAGITAMVACNKGLDSTPVKKDYTDVTGVTAKQPKVLFIVVDGAREKPCAMRRRLS